MASTTGYFIRLVDGSYFLRAANSLSASRKAQSGQNLNRISYRAIVGEQFRSLYSLRTDFVDLACANSQMVAACAESGKRALNALAVSTLEATRIRYQSSLQVMCVMAPETFDPCRRY